MFSKKRLVVAILLIVTLGVGTVLVLWRTGKFQPTPKVVVEENREPKETIIGVSVEGREIKAYTYGNGSTHLAFVGGMHGGYEWNSVLLAYAFMDYLDAYPDAFPDSMTIAVIPSANPDGVHKVIPKVGRFTVADAPSKEASVPGRFNANSVDLNRNFDCKWNPKGTWQGKTVSAGTGPFSEPETQAIRDFVSDFQPEAVVFWHSQANAVYASECEDGILSETLDIMDAYAKASGYQAVKSFDIYPVTGDAEGWLASIGIPAITVELKTHETVEWERNLLGIKALFGYYASSAESSANKKP